jgi:NAD(P) transhydrogenase subunit alpha
VPIAHIWYFRSLPNKIGYILGLPSKKLDMIIYYERYVVIQAGIATNTEGETLQRLDFLTEENLQLIYLIVLMIFVGIELIGHVPSVLHTPLMSGANAIHGVVIIGSIIVMGQAEHTVSLILGFLAVVLGTLNVVGGFVVTDRMLEMFKKKK